MKPRGEYSVRISGLQNGLHEFEFEIGNSFFKAMDHPDIEGGDVRALVILEKKPELMSLKFQVEGKLEVVCDRCLDRYLQSIQAKEDLYVKFGEEKGEMNENVIIVSRDEHEIIIDQHLFEFMVLALPYKRVHPDREDGSPGCNMEMINRLNEHIVDETHDTHDPRWDELKRLIEKNK